MNHRCGSSGNHNYGGYCFGDHKAIFFRIGLVLKEKNLMP